MNSWASGLSENIFRVKELEAAFASARCPDETDLLGQFEKSKAFVRSQY
jgi:hypothetical protein